MAPKSRSERGCRCAADIYDGCRNNRADRPLTAFTNCPIKSPLHSGLFHYFPNPRFCRLTSESQKNDVKKLCQKRCRNFGRNFAAKPPREQSSREGARADARRNAQSSSGGAKRDFASGRADAGTYANTPQGSAECCKWCLAAAMVE